LYAGCAADDESQVDGLPGQRLYAGFNGARSSPFFVCSACPGATMARSPPAADSDLGRRRRATRPSAGEGGGRRRKSSRGGGTARRGGSGIVRVGERERSGGREGGAGADMGERERRSGKYGLIYEGLIPTVVK
jgi:hypothetical protein